MHFHVLFAALFSAKCSHMHVSEWAGLMWLAEEGQTEPGCDVAGLVTQRARGTPRGPGPAPLALCSAHHTAQGVRGGGCPWYIRARLSWEAWVGASPSSALSVLCPEA